MELCECVIFTLTGRQKPVLVWGLLCFNSLCLCVSHSRDYVDKMEEARLAREER